MDESSTPDARCEADRQRQRQRQGQGSGATLSRRTCTSVPSANLPAPISAAGFVARVHIAALVPLLLASLRCFFVNSKDCTRIAAVR